MTNRSFRALTLGLLATTALVITSLRSSTGAIGRDARDADHAIAGARHQRDRCHVAARAGEAGAGRGRRPRRDRDHHHRDQARGESAERADQRPGASARGGSTSSTSPTSSSTPSSCRRSASRPRQPGFTAVYMRGVATGGDGNHTGSLPSVGSYLDEQPVTTIGGTLDVHIYDIARIESLAGPQGTLYGASSEAGTIRIITNKPELGVTTGRVDGELNTRRSRRAGRQARRHDQPADRLAHRVPRQRLLPARRGLHRQCPSANSRFAGDQVPDTIPMPNGDDHGGLRPERLPHRQFGVRQKELQHQQNLWRPRGAEDRPRRQLDGHADDHAPDSRRPRAYSTRMRRSAICRPSAFPRRSRASTSARNMR